jgi:tetratricopeptide (TPR) repeat protein
MRRLFWPVLLLLLSRSLLLGAEPDLLKEVDLLYLERDQPPKAELALELLRKELSTNPDNDEALWRMSRALKWEGDQRQESSEKIALYQQAADTAKKGIEANPKSVGAHFWHGVALGKIGETRGVLRSLFLVAPIKKEMETVISLDPNNDGAHLVLGVMYRKLPGFVGGSNNRSIEELEKSIALKPLGTLHRLELARTYLEEKKTDKAKEALRSILEIDQPYDPVEARRDRREAEEILSRLK